MPILIQDGLQTHLVVICSTLARAVMTLMMARINIFPTS